MDASKATRPQCPLDDEVGEPISPRWPSHLQGNGGLWLHIDVHLLAFVFSPVDAFPLAEGSALSGD